MIFRYLLATTFCLLFGTISLLSQNAGDNFYKMDVLHEIDFQFDQPDYWQQMENNFNSNFGGQQEHVYIMGQVTIDGEVVDSVGVRFKGFTSYPENSDKKPIKIDFNQFVDSKRYDGLRKMNLNNGTGDAAYHRDVLCYKILRDINGQYWGLYQVIEQVDKEFLDNNFADSDGNLYKNKAWSYLEWLGWEETGYKDIFQLKTNRMEDDWSGFIDLMDLINNSSDSEFENSIGEKFNVSLFLRTLAVDVATNSMRTRLLESFIGFLGIIILPWEGHLVLEGQTIVSY